MTNLVTDQLCLIQTRDIICLPFLAQTITPDPIRSLVIFNDENAMQIDHIKPQKLTSNARIKVKNGCKILAVTHSPKNYRLAGTVRTRENYQYIYEIPIVLTVRDAIAVARSYFQNLDPAQQAIIQLQQLIEKYISRIPFDKVQINNMPLLYWSNTELDQNGFSIMQIDKASFHIDPRYNGPDMEIFAIRRNRDIKLEEMQAEQDVLDYKDEQDRLNKEIKNEFERQEGTKDQLYKICCQIRDKTSEETIKALQARIQESFAVGESPNQIADIYFTLLGIFQGQKHADIENNVITAGLTIINETEKDNA
ncbi:hypothetical protein KDA_30610 [Dictyobacter alpinus]|uniref:Band 7 domain-containing protein n=1 Tax=Dictyobacter alpinus TaxID=2014873 RepID=A0A402B8D1_9CHLR|nr:hypothetical protein [Dictyobacter alpinus]GCE27577.1 hypothetical protein KDA_30610 [Dictyobacter alpinus]